MSERADPYKDIKYTRQDARRALVNDLSRVADYLCAIAQTGRERLAAEQDMRKTLAAIAGELERLTNALRDGVGELDGIRAAARKRDLGDLAGEDLA